MLYHHCPHPGTLGGSSTTTAPYAPFLYLHVNQYWRVTHLSHFKLHTRHDNDLKAGNRNLMIYRARDHLPAWVPESESSKHCFSLLFFFCWLCFLTPKALVTYEMFLLFLTSAPTSLFSAHHNKFLSRREPVKVSTFVSSNENTL